MQKSHDSSKVETMTPVEGRLIRVRFNADTASSMQWNFRPQQTEIMASDHLIIFTVHIVCRAGCMKWYSVRLSVPFVTCLLLWAQWTGDIDQLQQQQCAVGECGHCHVVSVCR